MKIPAEKLVMIGGLGRLPRIVWLEPNEDHPFEGYAVYNDGEYAATGTIPIHEWHKGVNRDYVEDELKLYVTKHPEECRKHLASMKAEFERLRKDFEC